MNNIIKEKINEIISNIVDQKLKENNSLSDAIQNNLEKCLMKRINHWVFYSILLWSYRNNFVESSDK